MKIKGNTPRIRGPEAKGKTQRGKGPQRSAGRSPQGPAASVSLSSGAAGISKMQTEAAAGFGEIREGLVDEVREIIRTEGTDGLEASVDQEAMMDRLLADL